MLNSFLASEQGTHSGTQTKVIANNALHADLMNMFADGRFLFRTDPAKAANYTFDRVKDLVSVPGDAGIKVTVEADVTFLALANATVSVQQQGEPAVNLQSDANGVADFSALPVGNYLLTVSINGYQTSQTPIKIKTGVHSRRKVLLTPTQQPQP